MTNRTFDSTLGASQLYRRSMCGAVRSEARAGTYGLVPGIGPEAAENAKLTIVWGNNATVANLHLVRKIRISLRKGGKLVVIDTLRTKIAEQADLHIAPRPSTDVLLAFALAVELKRIGAHDRAFIATPARPGDRRSYSIASVARSARRANKATFEGYEQLGSARSGGSARRVPAPAFASWQP